MQRFTSKILIHLQVLLLLVLPALAGALHVGIDCDSLTAVSAHSKHCHCEHTHSPKHPDDNADSPHDCSSCPVCQVLFAPRVTAAVCQAVVLIQQLWLIAAERPQCAESRLINVPQCRAPPADMNAA